MRFAVGAVLFASLAFGQEFEVATIKASPAPAGGRIWVRMADFNPKDPGRATYDFVTLRMLLAQAYEVKSYQISGPSTLDSERFDIAVKVPAGTDKAGYHVMMQNLLKDRFRMTIHKEKKELPAYSMVVAKGGPKMPVAAPEDPAAAADGPPQMQMTAGPPKMGKDGFPELPKGAPGGRMMVMMMPGRMRLMGDGVQMSQLATQLEQQLDKAVVDSTGLTEKYDVKLMFEPEQNRAMGGMPMMVARLGPPPGGEGGPANSADQEQAPSLFTAIQEQLGLRLEAKKIATELVVIDKTEKTPTEN